MTLLFYKRFCVEWMSRFSHIYQTSSRLSSSGEVLAALRPFYLAVHPDFMRHDETKQKVNENNLKKLNSFIECLKSNKVPEDTPTLHFYMQDRNKDSNENYRLVKVTLDQQSLQSSVQKIISACGLPVTNRIPPSDCTSIVEDHTFRNKRLFYRKVKPNNNEILQNRLSRVKNINLSKWLTFKLAKNESLAISSHFKQTEIDNACKIAQKELKLHGNIIFDHKYGIEHSKRAVNDLLQLIQLHLSDMQFLKGRVLIFGDQSGFHLNGEFVLGCTEDRYSWIKLLKKSMESSTFIILREIRTAEKILSKELGDAQIVHTNLKPTTKLEKHLYGLEKLSSRIAKHLVDNSSSRLASNNKLRFEFDCDADDLKLLDCGVIVVSHASPASEVLDFISKKSKEAVEKMDQHKSLLVTERNTQEKCVKNLCLASLKKDEEVSIVSMIACCELLLKHQKSFKRYVQNKNLLIGEFYSVLDDATICIPWNWTDTMLPKENIC